MQKGREEEELDSPVKVLKPGLLVSCSLPPSVPVSRPAPCPYRPSLFPLPDSFFHCLSPPPSLSLPVLLPPL